MFLVQKIITDSFCFLDIDDFGQEGFVRVFNYLSGNLLHKFVDQFQSFINIEQGNLEDFSKNVVIRVPLRVEPSRLSKYVFDPEMVLNTLKKYLYYDFVICNWFVFFGIV